MAKTGKLFKFHGAFAHKATAMKKEKRVKHAFIRAVKIHGKRRFLVLTGKTK
jgi:hypothetical protein